MFPFFEDVQASACGHDPYQRFGGHPLWLSGDLDLRRDGTSLGWVPSVYSSCARGVWAYDHPASDPSKHIDHLWLHPTANPGAYAPAGQAGGSDHRSIATDIA